MVKAAKRLYRFENPEGESARTYVHGNAAGSRTATVLVLPTGSTHLRAVKIDNKGRQLEQWGTDAEVAPTGKAPMTFLCPKTQSIYVALCWDGVQYVKLLKRQ